MKRVAQSSIMIALLGLTLIATCPVYGSWTTTVGDDNPAVWYQFEETTGTSAGDSGSAGETATYEGGVTLNQTGLVGRAALFDGVNDTVHATTVSLGASFSVEVLAKSVTSTWTTYDGFGGSRDANGFLFGGQPANTNIEAYIGSTATINHGVAGFDATPINAAFQHYVLTFDATNGSVKMYLNGTEKMSGTVTFTLGDPRVSTILSNMYVGADAQGNRFTNQLIDEWVLYNSVLSQSQVTAHFNSISATPEPSSCLMLATATFGFTFFARRRKAHGQGR